jgi:hypothetical protein
VEEIGRNICGNIGGQELYILKDKLTSFKMKDDESIPGMFHILQVIINDLKALGEKINDDDVSHRFFDVFTSKI